MSESIIVKEKMYLVWIQSKADYDFQFYIPAKEFNGAVAAANIILNKLIEETKDDTLSIETIRMEGIEMWSLTENEIK